MKYLPIGAELFTINRKRFVAEMQPNSIAIFNSNDEQPANADALLKFKQNSDLYWLTGIDQEDTMLILYPDNPNKKYTEVLVLTRPNELKEKWDGHRLRDHEGQEISGIKTIVWLDALPALLQAWMHAAEVVYLNTNEHDRKGNQLQTRDYRYVQQMKEQYPLHRYERAARILHKLRAEKTPQEIEVLKKAIDITAKAFDRVLKFVKPGVMEYEIEAEIMHEFLRNRATGAAYGMILASGDNARVLHYVENNKECKDGDLILMDFGAEYGGYNADLTRTIPVNGKFTPRQKELYNACLEIHRYCVTVLKPGISVNDYTQKVADFATQVFIKIKLLTEEDVKNEDPENRAYRKYLYHGISHHLGIDVHDVGPFNNPIKPGMVFTIEPGIYVEEEKIGIRLENNFLITEEGNIDLMKHIPIEADEIEKLMQS